MKSMKVTCEEREGKQHYNLKETCRRTRGEGEGGERRREGDNKRRRGDKRRRGGRGTRGEGEGGEQEEGGK